MHSSLRFFLSTVFLLLHSIRIAASPSIYHHPEELFYIYEWPDIARIVQGDTKSRSNLGMGLKMNEVNGSYDTFQFDLFPLIYNRAVKDPRRTLDPEKAFSFFIPYDMFMDTLTYRDKDNKEIICWDHGTNEQAPKVIEKLLSSKYFQKEHGRDHFLIVPFVAIEPRVHRPKLIPLYEICANCTKLVMEELTFLAEKGQAKNKWTQVRGPNWYK